MDRIKNSLSPRRGKKRNKGGDYVLRRSRRKKSASEEKGKRKSEEEEKKKEEGEEEVGPRLEDRAVLRSQGARGMMNIKAGQAVRVDSTLSARGVARRAKQQLSDQYFLCENHGRWRLGGRG